MKILHLRRSLDFKEITNQGDRYRNESLGIVSRTGKDSECIKVGIVITKKIYPKATQRNYIRRRIYSFFNENKEQLAGGKEIIVKILCKPVNVAKGQKNLSKKLREDLLNVCKKAGIC